MRKIAIVEVLGEHCYECQNDSLATNITDWYEVSEDDFYTVMRYAAKHSSAGKRIALLTEPYPKEKIISTVAEAVEEQQALEAKAQKEKELKEKKKRELKEDRDRKKFAELQKKFSKIPNK